METINLYFKVLIESGKDFHQKKGMTLASSSSFFALITLVPFLLLMIRGIGYFLGSLSQTQKFLFIIGSKFFPSIAPQFMQQIQSLIKGPLFADTPFTIFNFIFLIISTYTFLNSIWMGIYFITEDKEILSPWRILKGMAIIGVTFLMLGLVFWIPPLIIYIIRFLQNNLLTQLFFDTFEVARPLLVYIMKINLKKSYWLNSNFLHILFILTYFTLLYRWLFSFKISWKEGFFASIVFTAFIFLGKSLFWLYFYYLRGGLKNSYGDLYTSVLGVIWIFYLMCFFFFGACVCNIFRKNNQIQNLGPEAIACPS